MSTQSAPTYGTLPPTPTPTPTPTPNQPSQGIIEEIESYLAGYVSFADPAYAFVIALWLAATHTWLSFDAFPYLVVTSATKRSGKTRLLELMSFIAACARSVAHISPAAMFHTIHNNKPTLFIDEAEAFSSPKSEFRPLMNTGYRRGQTVLRQSGGDTVEYETYCPKAFSLIGDVYDTLRDRSIVIAMRRGTPQQRFVFALTQQEGTVLREMLHEIVAAKSAEVYESIVAFGGLPFLTDRDEEIWTPLFVMCAILCPHRIEELTRAAVDIATAKTADAKKFTELAGQEKDVEEQEYAERLLLDLITVIGDRKQITTAEAILLLRAIPTAPWRKFRGTGLKDVIDGAMDIAALLSRFGVAPKMLRIAPKREKNSTARGYNRQELVEAADQAGVLGRNPATQPCEAKPAPTSGSEQVATLPPTEILEATPQVVAAPEPTSEPAVAKVQLGDHELPASVKVTVCPPVVNSEDEDPKVTARVHANISLAANKVQLPLKPEGNYTVRPAPFGGFGVYEIGTAVCLQWYPTEDDAWDAILAVSDLQQEAEEELVKDFLEGHI
jgi:hypothetical protein